MADHVEKFAKEYGIPVLLSSLSTTLRNLGASRADETGLAHVDRQLALFTALMLDQTLTLCAIMKRSGEGRAE